MTKTKVSASPYIKLQSVAQAIELNDSNWENVVDDSFSHKKKLFDYQQEALHNAVKVLWKYFNNLNANKKEFAEFYDDLEIRNNLNITLKNNRHAELLKDYFETQVNSKGEEFIPFSEICNRMSFWMATGSGKTVVIIKLIEILHKLMSMKLIHKKEILFLTYRDDLIAYFKEMVKEYNHGRQFEEQIHLINLQEYEKHGTQRSFAMKVFYYRSDLISDEQKENILNFKTYLDTVNGKTRGNWYLILDEAHKGDKQDSKRQNIFSILSQEGFLFNFSATFTHPLDVVTTVFNFNLNKFITGGYGKQIYVSQEEVSAFKDASDFNDRDKRKIILKTLITLSAVKKAYDNVKTEQLYHNPLLIYLVHSVNTEDADLKLVFKEMAKIGKDIDKSMFETAKDEIIQEMQKAEYTISDDQNHILNYVRDFVETLTEFDIYRFVYNANAPGNIEYIINPKNRQEIALKLDSSDKPFALIKIGDISKWIEENLIEYKENESFKEEGYFQSLNDVNSSINILLGSRAFYEGWDSNRPNIISFINIGTGEDARKFVLQATGRGVRVEPVPGQKRRLNRLSVNSVELKALYNRFKNESRMLETLFIYATNKKAVETILEELEMVKEAEGFVEVSLWENYERLQSKQISPDDLLIPVYRATDVKVTELPVSKITRFRMSRANLDLLKLYFQLMPVERFIMEHQADYETYCNLKKIVENSDTYVETDESRNYRSVSMLITQLMVYINSKLEEHSNFVPVNDKIVHFKKIKVKSDHKHRENFLKTIAQVKDIDFSELEKIRTTLTQTKMEPSKIEDVIRAIKEPNVDNVQIRKLVQHFYVPIVYTKEKQDWIQHIINVESEYEFIEKLLKIVDEIDRYYDWWMFSKLDEYLDKDVYIPYNNNGKSSKFIPDFIFWFKKGNKYVILFLDPKGTVHDYTGKVNGYRTIFEQDNGTEKVFQLENGLSVQVMLKLFTVNSVNSIQDDRYRKYWLDSNNLKSVLTSLIS